MKNFPAIAIAQINVTVGDIAGNAAKITAAYDKAVGQGAELVVFPELSLVGYSPEDLVLMPAFREDAMNALRSLAKHTAGKAGMIVGSVWDNQYVTSGEDKSVYNAAVLMDDGRIQHVQPKTTLPNYGVFDEKRLYVPESPEPVEWRGHMLGLMVCEDIWNQEVAQQHKQLGADIIIVINASPFEVGKPELRRKVVCDAVKESGLPVVYAALVGGQDDIVFDGGSFAVDSGCNVIAQFPQFKEEVAIIPPPLGGRLGGGLICSGGDDSARLPASSLMGEEEQLWSAMKLGLSDYIAKNNFPGVLIGLSGGIDSALTAAVAVDALGKNRVRGVLLSSPYTSKDSVEDALELANNIGIETISVPITSAMEIMQETLDPVFSKPLSNSPPLCGREDTEFPLPEGGRVREGAWMENVSIGGNLQARLRGVILMALSNQSGFMLMSTGNKSEIAVGYSTLYGDSCGGYNVLKDVYKTQVYALARWRNSIPSQTLSPDGERGRSFLSPASVDKKLTSPSPALAGEGRGGGVIPIRSITKAPTAELKPGQKDQDQLPPYDILDAILAHHIEGRLSEKEIVNKGFDAETVCRILKLVRINEYKRRQSCPGVKLSSMHFGKDRRYPLTNRYQP